MQVVGGGFAGGGETTPDNVADSTISITQRKPHAFDGSGGRKPPRQYGISTTTLKKPMAMQRHLTIASPLIRGTFAACTSLRSRCRADETEATVAIQTIDKVTTAIRESELAAPFVPTATASDARPPHCRSPWICIRLFWFGLPVEVKTSVFFARPRVRFGLARALHEPPTSGGYVASHAAKTHPPRPRLMRFTSQA